MKKISLILLCLIAPLLTAQSQFQEFIEHVNSLTDSTAKAAAVDSFINYARNEGIPFLEDSTANFIYRGNVNTAALAGDFNNWSASAWMMTKLSQTNFWYRSENFEMDARLDYKFVMNGNNWILDPENPRTCAGGFGPNSELSMPQYVQPWEIIYRANINHGTIVNKVISSTNTGSNFQLNIYLPPGYDSLSAAEYPTVYFQDGAEYLSLGMAANVIDNLLDSQKIAPVIGVFVKPNNRNEEYAGALRDEYILFFVNELVPYIDSHFKTIQHPEKRLVLGDSFGGNISALISYNHDDVFGLCGLHSGAFWPNGYEAYNLIINGPVKNIKWSAIWGTYESLFPNMRSFRDSLISFGYEFDWLERPEGHSWGLWRASIDRMLEYFFPHDPTDVSPQNNILHPDFVLNQNYPNPFNPSTIISFSLPEPGQVSLKLYDILGNEIAVLLNENKQSGNYQVEFHADNLSSGIYFYRLTAGDYTAVKKLQLLK